MPLLLLIGFGMSAFFAILGSFVYTGILLISVLGNGPYTVDDEQVEKAVYLREMLPLFLGYPLVVGVFGFIAYGIWKEKPWSRDAMMAFWVVSIVVALLVYFLTDTGTTAGSAAISIVNYGFMAAIAWWYLYSKKSVVDYYQALSAKSVRDGNSLRPADSGRSQ